MNEDEYAEALESSYSKLKKFMKETTADLDAEINVRDHLFPYAMLNLTNLISRSLGCRVIFDSS